MRPRAGRRSSISRFGPRRKRLARPHPPQRLLSPGSDLVSPPDPVKVKRGPLAGAKFQLLLSKPRTQLRAKERLPLGHPERRGIREALGLASRAGLARAGGRLSCVLALTVQKSLYS